MVRYHTTPQQLGLGGGQHHDHDHQLSGSRGHGSGGGGGGSPFHHSGASSMPMPGAPPRLAVHAEHRWTWDARPRYDPFAAWASASSAPASAGGGAAGAASSGGGGVGGLKHLALVPGDWRLSAARVRAQQAPAQGQAVRATLALLYKTAGVEEPLAWEEAALGSPASVMLPGSGTDPLAWLTLRVRWQAAGAAPSGSATGMGGGKAAAAAAAEGSAHAQLPLFVDNAFYSDFQPLETAPQAWRLSAAFAPDEVLLPAPLSSQSSLWSTQPGASAANANGNANVNCGYGGRAPTPLPAPPSVAPLAARLRSLLASYVAAQAVSPGTTMAELAREDGLRGGGVEAEAERAEADRLAVSIASHLGPHMAALVRQLASRPPPSPKDVEDLAALLLPPPAGSASASGAEEDDDDDGDQADDDAEARQDGGGQLSQQRQQQHRRRPSSEQEQQGRRRARQPGAAMRAPVGGLVSLLAASFGGLETLSGMALLWVQVVGGLRWGWDRGCVRACVRGRAGGRVCMGLVGME